MSGLVHGRDRHDESIDLDMLGQRAGDTRKVDRHVAQVLSSFCKSDVDDFAVSFAHKETASIDIFENFRTDQGFPAVLHRMLEIQIQIGEIAGQDALGHRLRKAARHANPEREAQRASILYLLYRFY